MDVCGSHDCSLTDLCERLRSEKLLITSELENLRRLNEIINSDRNSVVQLAWLDRKLQVILNKLINSHPSVAPENCCMLAAQLESSSFFESHHRVDGQHHSTVIDLLNYLFASPITVAELLYATDQKLGTKEDFCGDDLVQCIFTFLYGCCAFPADERRVLEVLSHLMHLQIISRCDPRLVLRRGNNSFCKLYRTFSEDLHATKIFLTAALHEPVMYLLSHDEMFLDIESSKSVLRFPREERKLRFGDDENSLGYLQNLTIHRNSIETKLIAISSRFIKGTVYAMTSFPSVISWLVRHLYASLIERDVGKEQSTLICTDLIFTHLICPAIANPETSGVIADTPISYTARFNLMQVGQILQTLAVAPFEQPPIHLAHFYSQFDQNSMAQVIQLILNGDSKRSLDSLYSSAVGYKGSEQFVRHHFVGSVDELNCLISMVNSSALDFLKDHAVRRELRSFALRLPTKFNGLTTLHSNKVAKEELSGRAATHSSSTKRVKHYIRDSQKRLHKNLAGNLNQVNQDQIAGAQYSDIEVLMFPFNEERVHIGLCSEEKFMATVQQPIITPKHKLQNAEKRTRFVDAEGLGILSDCMTCGGSEDEARSLSSSIDGNVDGMYDDREDASTFPDNFSDVMASSANISGRVSPSISDPNSIGAQDANQSADSVSHVRRSRMVSHTSTRRINMLNIPVTVRRENSECLEEQFGKFTLPQSEGRNKYPDEAHSLLSENWSTDVLPSDTEGMGVDGRAEFGNNTLGPSVSVRSSNPCAVQDVLPNRTEGSKISMLRNASFNRTAGRVSDVTASMLATTFAEDHSDTWSVDAVASDSEADHVSRNYDFLIDENDEAHRNLAVDIESNAPTNDLSDNQGDVIAGGSNDTRIHRENSLYKRDAVERTVRSYSATVDTLNRCNEISDEGFTVFREVTLSGVDAEGSPGLFRRQSSAASSFYSKSDVESEFSNIRDLNDDASSSVLGDYVPSFRDSIGEIQLNNSQVAPPQVVEDSFHNQDEDKNNSVLQNEQQTPGDVPESASDCAKASQVDLFMMGQGTPCSSQSRKLELMVRNSNTGYGSAGLDQNKFGKVAGNRSDASVSLHESGIDSTKKRINFFHGLQKVGESLKIRKGLSVNSLRQSLSQATTMNEIGSVHAVMMLKSVGNERNFEKHDRKVESEAVLNCRALSQSLSELNQETGRMTANEILDKYKGRLPTKQVEVKEIAYKIESTADGATLCDLYYDPKNLMQCRAFLDVKRKLRLVLSSFDSIPGSPFSNVIVSETLGENQLQLCNLRPLSNMKESEKLVNFLHILLAESINAQDRALTAQIREVLRCLLAFDGRGIRKLLRTLKDEHRRRTSYLLYLQQSRLTLLQLHSCFEKLINQMLRQKFLIDECLVEVLVGFYLQQRKDEFHQFIEDFKSLNAQDERTDAVECLVQTLCESLPSEEIWQYGGDTRLAYARKSIERALMARIYKLALFPNGDADQCRDSVFHKSIRNLAHIITPDHPELRIPSRFHGESPWPSAQAEIAIINAYKTPRDKSTCVMRCCETIQNLIMLAAEQNHASADDITPVLVYVLIQANPQALLSNIQYINEFYNKRMEGVEAYWWVQFTSAVEFIKTLLNRHF